MLTARDQAQPIIDRLSVHYHGRAEDVSAVATRLRIERLLGTVDIRPSGLPTGAVLIVRTIHHLIPLSIQAQFLPPDWIEHLRNHLNDLYAHAARPALNPNATSAGSVIFVDPAEMLACLTRDVLNEQVWNCWYWQQVVQSIPHIPSLVLATLWSNQAMFVPAALSMLKQSDMYAAISLLSPAEVSTVTHALHAAFELPSTDILNGTSSTIPNDALPVAHPGNASTIAAFSRQPAIPPWLPFLPAAGLLPAVTPHAQYLLGLALTLHHAPSFARSTRFVLQAASWLNVEASAWVRPSDPKQTSARKVTPLPTFPLMYEKNNAPEENQILAEDPKISKIRAEAATREASQTIHGGMPVEEALSLMADGITTELGGILYLINVLRWLDLPGCWDEEGILVEHLGGWGVIEALARGLLSAVYEQVDNDPIWNVLAQLAGRATALPVGATLPQLEAFRLPAQWLRHYGPPVPAMLAQEDHDRLLLFDKMNGYLIADVPLSGRSLAETAVTEVEKYQMQGINTISWDDATGEMWQCTEWSRDVTLRAPVPRETRSLADGRTQGDAPMLSQTVTWWLQRVSGFIRYALACVSGEDGESLVDMLFYKHAHVSISHTHINLHMSMEQINLPIRKAGLDRDPGWVPDLGYSVLFHFDEERY